MIYDCLHSSRILELLPTTCLHLYYSSPLVDTGSGTPSGEGVSAADQHSSSAHVQPPPSIEATSFTHYDFVHRQIGRDYYKETQRGVAANHANNNRFVVQRSAHSIVVKDGNVIIFKIFKGGVSPRNLYLELHSCKFDVESWREKRDQGEFGEWEHGSRTSPPQSSSIWSSSIADSCVPARKLEAYCR